MKATMLVAIILAFLTPARAGDDIAEVKKQLDWCVDDTGYNEGADEALALSRVIADLGNNNAQTLVKHFGKMDESTLANQLDRPFVIATARSFVRTNAPLAVALALTCQSHNAPVRMLLTDRYGLVVLWLRGEL